MIYLILTSKRHATKIVNHLNHNTNIFYFISTDKNIDSFNYDIGVCYGYPHLIAEKTLEKHIFYNYHPAPLPVYGDWGNYARGLHDLQSGKLKKWGVSLHRIDKNIDKGEVLKVLDIDLMSIPVDIQELGDIGHYCLFQLFKQTIEALKFCPLNKEELWKCMR